MMLWLCFSKKRGFSQIVFSCGEVHIIQQERNLYVTLEALCETLIFATQI